MKLFKNILVVFPDQSPGRIDIQEFSRGGSKSPKMWVFLVNGRRLTPKQQDHYGYSLTISGLFALVYNGESLYNLTYIENPFMSLIPKDYVKVAKYPIVIFE